MPVVISVILKNSQSSTAVPYQEVMDNGDSLVGSLDTSAKRVNTGTVPERTAAILNCSGEDTVLKG